MRGNLRRRLAASLRVLRWWPVGVLIGVLVLVTYVMQAVANYPAERAAEYRNTSSVATAIATIEPKDHLAFERDLLQFETDNQIKIWTGIVQAIGAIVLGIGGYFTWRNLRVTQERLDVDRESQITGRFTQAIGQLGAELKDGRPNLEVRLGGIYALERIARDSPRDHWTIMEVLTAYVRENARWIAASPDSDPMSHHQGMRRQTRRDCLYGRGRHAQTFKRYSQC